MQKLKAEIDEQLSRHLETHPFWNSVAVESPEGFGTVRDTLLTPGKRLRPLLFCAACRDAGMDPFPGLMPVALALELAHSFILIHDDIIDRSAMRRGAPTLPKRVDELFAENPADGFRGSDFALVTGDLLYTLAIESLLQADAADEQKVAMIRLFTRAAQATGRGALLEMRVAQASLAELTPEDIETIYALKTGSYTFELPLQLAAVFSNVWKKREQNFPNIGKHAGISFQLRNDLNDLQQWLDGGPLPDDIRDERRTWPLVYAGSGDALRNEQTLTAVRQAMALHAQQAVDLVGESSEVQDVLNYALF